MTEYTLPIRLQSITNLREHWGARHKRAQIHRNAAIVIGKHKLPCTVEIIRVGKKEMDLDNLMIAGKNLRDGIADRLGVKDNDPRITWKYSQQIGDYSAIVRISDANEA